MNRSVKLIVSLFLISQTISGISSIDTILFSCHFVRGTCDMKNEERARAFWQNEYLHKGRRMGYAMVVRGNEAKNNFARFQTPFITTTGITQGCIKFKYFIEGRTPASIAVIKQGAVTQYLFATARRTEDKWEEAEIDVEFLGDQVMFYFEADTRTQDFGSSLVAFTDLVITSNPCTFSHYG
nr:uncharacterized protein LOC107448315 [Parasteatoda tepidariorum]